MFGCVSIISVICFIVHYQLIFHKVETIRLCFIWMIDQLLHCKKSERNVGVN